MKTNEHVGRMINILSKKIKRQVDFSTSSIGVTGVQGRVLHFILAQYNERDFFQKDIEEEFNLRRSSATGILQLMEKNGLIKRESVSYDARLKKIILTEKAIEMKSTVMNDIESIEESLKRNISAEELEIFYKVMDQMSKNLNE